MELEAVLLDRHLDRCAACRRFADDVVSQTELLRSVEFEALPLRADGPVGVSARLRARRGIAAGAVAMSAVAATVALTIGGNGGTPSFGLPSAQGEAVPVLQEDSLGVHRIPVRKPGGDRAFMRGELGLPT